MILVRTPFRISFIGGGTDYPSWLNNDDGFVIGTTINKYSYIAIKKTFQEWFPYKSKIVYSKIEEVTSNDDIEHAVIRNVLQHFNISFGVELCHFSDLRSKCGMGSSSSFLVGLINAVHLLDGKKLSSLELCRAAIYFEQVVMKENVGYQDSCWASYGGLRFFAFSGKKIRTAKLNVDKSFQDHIVLFWTDQQRKASDIVETYKSNLKDSSKQNRMYRLAKQSLRPLSKGDFREFARLIDESWQVKKTYGKVSTEMIDSLYNKGKSLGAWGGKLLGAGGGGVFMFLCDPDAKNRLVSKICLDLPVKYIPIKFSNVGSEVLFSYD